MNEFLTRYFSTRSSRKRSGSNSSAAYCVYDGRSTEGSVALTIRSPEIFASMHHEDRIYNSDKASESTIYLKLTEKDVPCTGRNIERLVIGIRVG